LRRGEIAPMVIEAIFLVKNKFIDDGRAIELCTKSIED
jgi:hypothetical protein